MTSRGGVRSEFTVYRTGAESFYLVSAGAWERHDHDTLKKLMPTDGSVRFQPLTAAMGVLVVAGPRSRDLLQMLTDADLSNAAFPWLTGKSIDIGAATAHALRVNFVGELGWELHHPIEMQNTILDALLDVGKPLGIKPFGIRAMMAMSVEKSYRLIGRELSIEYAALESGLDRFVHPNKGQFLGRDALVAWREKGFAWRFVTMEVHGVTDADARGSEPILTRRQNDRPLHLRRLWLAGRQIPRSWHGQTGIWRARPGAYVTILGEPHRATVIAESPFDPDNARLRRER